MSLEPRYCDVSLPVPLDQLFTYALPETLRHRVRRGSRLIVPFGKRKLTGFILRCHNEPPDKEVRTALRLVDEEPVLNEELLALGEWISSYYCAPLGEVLRAMTPLAAEIRQGKLYALTEAGRAATRQLFLGDPPDDPEFRLLHLLESRPLTAEHLNRKIRGAAKLLKSLERKGMVQVETAVRERDPLRSPAGRLRVARSGQPVEEKLPKTERELLAYLELHPGSHNLAELEAAVKNASRAARSLARRGLVQITPEELKMPSFGAPPAPLQLTRHQQAALDLITARLARGGYEAFLLFGVTGSGKTEIYLRAIEAALRLGKGALLLVPEIALTPAMAGQFFERFGDRVAILHSAFSDSERAAQWRRICSGAAPVVVGTRSGVFAPVANLGLIVVDEEHDQSYKQDETPRYNGRDVALVRARNAGACVILGSATPSLESRYNAAQGKYTLLELPERVERRPLPAVELIDMRMEFLETRRQ